MFLLFAPATLVSVGIMVYNSCLSADFKMYCYGTEL